MKRHLHQICCPIVLAAMLGGCAAADGRYPSLAVRDAERVSGTINPSAPDIQTPITPLNLAPIKAAIARAEAANSKFASQTVEVRTLVAAARGSGLDSDRRSHALAALAGLTSLRGQTALALADIDLLEAKAASGFERTQEIREAQSAVVRLVMAQDEALDSLSAQLAR